MTISGVLVPALHSGETETVEACAFRSTSRPEATAEKNKLAVITPLATQASFLLCLLWLAEKPQTVQAELAVYATELSTVRRKRSAFATTRPRHPRDFSSVRAWYKCTKSPVLNCGNARLRLGAST